MPIKSIALILHAGAGRNPKDLRHVAEIQSKLAEIVKDGYRFLRKHTAVETVVEVVRRLEDWPETNAGTGAMLQADGKARLSASLMDGSKMRFSGVINIEKIKNPILVAELLQHERDRLLASDGAFRFAREMGFKPYDPRTKESLKRWQQWKKEKREGKFGTVGACALDSKGRLAAATSTGGKGMERVGRASDSALPAGNYANAYTAVSATGLGEHIIEESLASTIAIRAADLKNLRQAFRITFEEAKRRNRRFAAVGLDQKGNALWAQTTGILYYAFKTNSGFGTFNF